LCGLVLLGGRSSSISRLDVWTRLEFIVPSLGWTGRARGGRRRGERRVGGLVDDLSDSHVITCLDARPMSSNHSLIHRTPRLTMVRGGGRVQRRETGRKAVVQSQRFLKLAECLGVDGELFASRKWWSYQLPSEVGGHAIVSWPRTALESGSESRVSRTKLITCQVVLPTDHPRARVDRLAPSNHSSLWTLEMHSVRAINSYVDTGASTRE
jgi:hypothetical protein